MGVDGLGKAKFAHDRARARIVIEKPFGHDLNSARTLNQTLLEVFDEPQIYRIDHYLGKETVQNILAFRFANALFEPLWEGILFRFQAKQPGPPMRLTPVDMSFCYQDAFRDPPRDASASSRLRRKRHGGMSSKKSQCRQRTTSGAGQPGKMSQRSASEDARVLGVDY